MPLRKWLPSPGEHNKILHNHNHNHKNKNSRLFVTGALFSSPIDNLSSIANKSSNSNTTMGVNRMYPTTAIRQQHLVQDWLLDAEDDSIAAFQSERSSRIFNCFGCILYLENAPVWWECWRGEIVSASWTSHCIFVGWSLLLFVCIGMMMKMVMVVWFLPGVGLPRAALVFQGRRWNWEESQFSPVTSILVLKFYLGIFIICHYFTTNRRDLWPWWFNMTAISFNH